MLMIYSALIIDNDPIVVNRLESVLIDQGMSVSSAKDQKGALDLVESSQFHIVFLGSFTKREESLELLSALKQKNPETIVAMVTSDRDSDKIIQCMRLGADDYLIKPVSDQQIVSAVIQLLEKIDHREKLEKKKLDSQRRNNLQSLGFMARGIAHDFNNILAAVLGHIEVAGSMLGTGTKEEIAALLDGGAHAVHQSKKITSTLLTFAEGDYPVKELTLVDDFFIKHILPGIKEKEIAIDYSSPHDLGRVMVDPDQMLQVISNVVMNAVKAVEKQGSIDIRCSNINASDDPLIPVASGDYVSISIADNGPGISKEVLSHIFDPYFTTKEVRNNKGMGLGLAICHSVVQRHNGYITAESTPGSGTRVVIFLPMAKEEPAAETSKNSDQLVFHSETRIVENGIQRVLFMDDETLIRDVVERFLKEMGYEPLMAAEGDSAVQLYLGSIESGKSINGVILDLTNNLGMGGIETLKQLKEIDPDVKAVVASGYYDDPVMHNYKDYGFYAAIEKPFRYKDLKKILAALVSWCPTR